MLNSVEVRAAAGIMAGELLAREHLLDYCRRMDPTYQTPRHILLLADYLERLERGEIDRLCISMPPRHGKSRLTSQLFASWYIGRHPKEDLVLASYAGGAELSEDHSRVIRDLVSSENNPFEVALRADSRAVNRWHTSAGGQVLAVSVGAGLTGHGAHLMIIDDPVKDREQAESETIRKATREWYSDVARTRLAPGGKIVLLGTRWHWEDLIGTILEHGGNRWTVLNLPAVADNEHDPLGRSVGEALWPERFPVDSLPKVPDEMSSRSFSALFQGQPTPSEGVTFKPEWFEHRYDGLPNEARFTFQAVDSAWKEGLSNDRTAIATLATDTKDIYIVDLWFGRVNYTDLRRVAIENYQKHTPRLLYVEEAASGYALVDSLRRSTGIPVRGIPPGRESKEARAEAVTNWFEAGRIKFPRNATWMAELLNEFLRFPHGRHDDIVDAVVLGVSQTRDFINRVVYEGPRRARNQAIWRMHHT